MEEGDTDWERAHLIEREAWKREMPTGRERTGEWKGIGDRDTDWERAHLIRWEWYEGRRHRLGESALDSGRE